MGVAATHFDLLFIGERENTQRQHLVHLGAIEAIPDALGCGLRIIIKNDRRTENATAIACFAGKDRKDTILLALFGVGFNCRLRFQQRNEGTSFDAKQQMSRGEGYFLDSPARERLDLWDVALVRKAHVEATETIMQRHSS